MNKLLKPLSLASLSLGFCLATLANPAQSQQVSAYAPENLQTLAYEDQVRVISVEYSEQANGRRIPDDQLRFYLDQVQRSNWSFSQIKADIASSLSRGRGVDPPLLPGDVRCESLDGRAESCSTPWAGHSRLIRQLSIAPCTKGSSWSSQRGKIFVDQGCRADFAEVTVAAPKPGSFRCANAGARYNVCAAPWRGQSKLSRSLAGATCVEGRSWGSTQGHVWVTRGCKGEFVAAANSQPQYSVTCVSSGGTSPNTCAWDRSKGRPYLVQQLSQVRCTENVTWGYNLSRGLWVSGGCRARFGVR